MLMAGPLESLLLIDRRSVGVDQLQGIKAWTSFHVGVNIEIDEGRTSSVDNNTSQLDVIPYPKIVEEYHEKCPQGG